MADILDFQSKKNEAKENKSATPKVPDPGVYEFHLHPTDDMKEGETLVAEGYVKFGPVFIAVVDGIEDTSNVLLAIATGLVKYTRKLEEKKKA